MSSLSFDPITSTTSQIVLNWSLLSTFAETGGSAIVNYIILWDSGSGAGSFSTQLASLSNTVTTHTETGLTTNTDYQFKIYATN